MMIFATDSRKSAKNQPVFPINFKKKVTWFCNIFKINEIKMQKSGKKFGVLK